MPCRFERQGCLMRGFYLHVPSIGIECSLVFASGL
jgi:hypothetical protein